MNDLSYATGLHRNVASVVMTEIVRLTKKPTIPRHTVRLMPPATDPITGVAPVIAFTVVIPNQRLVQEL